MGWSDAGMARRCEHRTARVRGDIAARVPAPGRLLWRPAEAAGDDLDDGAAEAPAKVA
jgi:hypothetical protein